MSPLETQRVSAILAVYNTPVDQLRPCLESILAQDHENLEICLVDDGSEADRSAAYRWIARMDDRIRYHHQRNAGVSAARNAGLAMAIGDWITFVDGDDWLEADCFSSALRCGKRLDLDVVCGGMAYHQGPRAQAALHAREQEWTGPRESLLAAALWRENLASFGVKGELLGFSTAKMYRREVLDDLAFPEGIPLREDSIFTLRLLKKEPRIGFSPGLWYNYRLHAASASLSYRPDNRMECDLFLAACWEIWADLPGGEDAYQLCVLQTYMSYLKRCLLHPDAPGGWGERQRKVEATFHDPLWEGAFARTPGGSFSRAYRVLWTLCHRRSAAGVLALHQLHCAHKKWRGKVPA